jgi:hypothetical protein
MFSIVGVKLRGKFDGKFEVFEGKSNQIVELKVQSEVTAEFTEEV